MTIDEQGAIIKAYKRGEEIEIQDREGIWWTIDCKYPTNYEFDFQGYDYRVKQKKWRAENGGGYYYVNVGGVVICGADGYFPADNNRYEFGNYFRTEKQAEEARESIKETLTKFHEEV